MQSLPARQRHVLLIGQTGRQPTELDGSPRAQLLPTLATIEDRCGTGPALTAVPNTRSGHVVLTFSRSNLPFMGVPATSPQYDVDTVRSQRDDVTSQLQATREHHASHDRARDPSCGAGTP